MQPRRGSWVPILAQPQICWGPSAKFPSLQCQGVGIERAGEDTAPPQRAIINIWKLLAALAIPGYPHCVCATHVAFLLLLSGGYLLLSLLITYCTALKTGRRGKEWLVFSHHGKAKCYILYLSKVKILHFKTCEMHY